MQKYRDAGPIGWEIVTRDGIGERLAVGRDWLGVAPKKLKEGRICQRMTHRRSMACRLGVGEGEAGKAQRLVNSPEPPQCESVQNLR